MLVVVPVRGSFSGVDGVRGLVMGSVDAGWPPPSAGRGGLDRSGVQVTTWIIGVADPGESSRFQRWPELVMASPCAFLKASLR
jgi:hypothetical protein